jgi:hypothetical protein
MNGDGFILDDFRREVMAELGLQPYVLAPAQGAAVSVSPVLLEALARAAGCTVETVAALPGLDALPASAAKRALWPRLRRMRTATR